MKNNTKNHPCRMCKHFGGYDSVLTDDDVLRNNGSGIFVRIPICEVEPLYTIALQKCEMFIYETCPEKLGLENKLETV